MAAFDLPHSSATDTMIGALAWLDLPSIEMPPVALPSTLDSIGNFANQLQTVITSALSHPFWTIGIVIVSIGLLQLLADLVKRILKAGIGFILTFPLSLSQWLWQRAITPSAPKTDKADITQLLARLETLRTEQDQVIAALTEHLQSSAIINDTKQPPLAANSAPPALQSSAESPQS